jgi:hypothetical protein
MRMKSFPAFRARTHVRGGHGKGNVLWKKAYNNCITMEQMLLQKPHRTPAPAKGIKGKGNI